MPSRKSMGTDSPTRKAFASAASPVRNIGSPFTTPRAGSSGHYGDAMSPMSSPGKGRLSLKTPKGRIPSAVSMPPPSSPSMALSSLAISLNDDFSMRSVGSPRPDSSSSLRSTPVHELLDDVSRLQSRLDALEFENQQLRESQSQPPPEPVDNSADLMALQVERDEMQSRVVALESSLKTQERSLDERETKIQGLERSMKETVLDISKIKSDNENRIRDIQARLDDSESLNKNLKELLEAKEGQENANDAVLTSKSAEVSVLEGRVEKVYKELEEERRELGSQVDELRKAGQVSCFCLISLMILITLCRRRLHYMRSGSVRVRPDDTRWRTILRLWKISYDLRLDLLRLLPWLPSLLPQLRSTTRR